MPDSKPIRDTAEELYGALDGWPPSIDLCIGRAHFSAEELRALALFVKEGAAKE